MAHSYTVGVELAATTDLTGLFTIGVSLLGGSDELAAADRWTAVPATDLRSVSIRRGRPDDTRPYDAGQSTIVLENRSGAYDPDNANSRYVTAAGEKLLRNGCGMRVLLTPAAGGAAQVVFTGTVSGFSLDHGQVDPVCVIEAEDTLAALGRTPIVALPDGSSSGDTTSDRASWLLDAAGVPTGYRSLAGSRTVLGWSGGGTARSALEVLAAGEAGRLLASSAGVVVLSDHAAEYGRNIELILTDRPPSAPLRAASLRDTIRSLSPVAYWRMGEPSGSTLADSSGNGHDLTVSGTPDAMADASVLPSGEGASIQFGATAAVHAYAADAAWNSLAGAWSAVIHYRNDTYDSFQQFFAKDAWVYSMTGGYGLFLDGTTSAFVGSGSGGLYFDDGVSQYGRFVQLVVSFDGSTMRTYVNGVACQTGTPTAPSDTSGSLIVGSTGSADTWFGQDFALWDRAVDSGEVAQMWAAANGLGVVPAGVYSDIRISPGDEALANVAVVSRPGLDDVRAADSESVAVHGHRGVSADVLLAEDGDTTALAAFLASRRAVPTRTVDIVSPVVARADTSMLGALSAADLGSLIQVERTTLDGRALAFLATVEGFAWDLSPGRQSLTLTTAPSDTSALFGSDGWFTIGSSLLGSATDLLAPY